MEYPRPKTSLRVSAALSFERLLILYSYQLAVLNPSINEGCTNLTPGQVLCLGTPDDDCSTTYVVKPNDSCDDVAAAHKIDPSVLYHNNPQLDAKCDNMYIGEVCVLG
jgi:LysM domain